RLVDVLAAERVGGRGENRDLVHARGPGPIEPGEIRHEGGVADSGLPRDPLEHLRGIRHLGHPFRTDEGRYLDHRQVRGAQTIEEFDLVRSGHECLLVWQAVTRPHLDHLDALAVERHAANSTSSASAATSWPSRPCTAETMASPVARMGSSIFIASRS